GYWRADGRAWQAGLDTGGALERAGRRGSGEARAASGRTAHRVPREEGPARARRRVLSAPTRLALLRPGRGSRHALRVPRLEVRDGRPLSGDAERAARIRLRVEDPPRRLSMRGSGRHDLGVHGTGEPSAADTTSRVDPAAGLAQLRVQAGPGVQLVPGDGGRHRLEPHLAPARAPRPRRPRGDTRPRPAER